MYIRLPNWLANYPTPNAHPFFVTIPKSGTVYLRQSIRKSLGLRQVRISSGPFPEHFLQPAELARGKQNDRVVAAHPAPHDANVAMLEEYFGRWVLHLRDPRAATLSWVHHVCKYREQEPAKVALVKFASTVPSPEAIVTWSFDDLLDWHIKNFIPVLSDWTTGWLEYMDSGKHTMLATTHEEMVTDRDAFWEKIADFYEVPSDRLKAGDIGQKNRHFRSGRTDEWQEAFSDEQLKIASSLVPQALKDRFGWAA